MKSWLAVLAVAMTVVGCGGAPDTDVEVFTWWANGSERAGLDALVTVFEEQHPGLTFVNGAVAGGAGSTARDVLNYRMGAGDPPDTFQAHAGKELTDYILGNRVQDLKGLYDENGWSSVFPEQLLQLLTVDGKIYSVPSNVHRANVVWGNADVLTRAGLDMESRPENLDDWFVQLDRIKAAGIVPLAIGKDWTQVHLLEVVLLARLGANDYTGLFDGRTDWRSPAVAGAVADFARLMSYTNSDFQFLDWEAATQLVIDGKAAYNVMGDWAEVVFREQDWRYDVDYIAFPVPGTADEFDFLADSFTLPVGARDEGGARAWLETVGSVEGQKAFNIAKGSIPARTDIGTDGFGPYQTTAIASYMSDDIVPSLAHGAATPVRWLADITAAVRQFGTKQDVAALTAALIAAAEQNRS
ncbi:carbohydrate ABC transporter substrate-binding protein [Antrihabitans sp. YC3-6]|uniref:Probable sugar-binding periplasmic protein n=1 Tax=Antrihabitans stalagmiti TaxID=2799499 RepID=A0A934NPK4_9NOCA|nr:ABC transporter substrate-binding protein [Antrihabitans stalagmiti]MBJ8338982.1 carbohydrate ABC transporter substrate-binding protein [Antrihabitans stalagmiti]